VIEIAKRIMENYTGSLAEIDLGKFSFTEKRAE